MTVEVSAEVQRVAGEWDDLADRVEAEPFLRPGWIMPWWQAFGRGEPLEILCIRDGGRLTGVLPLVGAGASVRAPANWHTPRLAPLVEDAGTLRELGDAMFGLPGRRVTLGFLPTAGGIADGLADSARAAGRRVLVRELQRSPVIVIDGDWATYERGLSSNLKADIRRRRRLLDREGEVEVEVVTGAERLDDLLTEGFGVEAAGWKGERHTAIDSSPETRQFYAEVARWADARGWLALEFLRLDGRPLAFHLCLQTGGAHYFLKGGYDQAFGRFSPSKVLHHVMIERAFEQGLARYEFLGGDEPYKLQWTRDVSSVVLLQAFDHSPAGALDWAAFAWARPAVKRSLTLAGRLRPDRS